MGGGFSFRAERKRGRSSVEFFFCFGCLKRKKREVLDPGFREEMRVKVAIVGQAEGHLVVSWYSFAWFTLFQRLSRIL